MANELNIVLDSVSQTGLTVISKVRAAGGTQQGGNVTMTEPSNGVYTGNYSTTGLSDGVYSVEFINNSDSSLLGTGQLMVKSETELVPGDINIKYVNNILVGGTGAEENEWGPA